jgi:hypothetical protein
MDNVARFYDVVQLSSVRKSYAVWLIYPGRSELIGHKIAK